jgi:PilZ domain
MELPCTLRRRSGSPISARTEDVGPGGMCVVSPRPLAPDEVLSFDLGLDGDPRLDGRARVLRQQGMASYALRFESLSEPKLERLRGLVVSRV